MSERLEIAALTIAGSDSCGGAGIQADLKTFQAFGVYGASAITALTAQNTLGVHSILSVNDGFLAAQLESVLDDLPIRAIKTGMLPGPGAIETVAEVLMRRCAGIPLIVDPVLVATSGSALTVEDTVEALRAHLLPLATLVTPNLEEASALSDGSRDPLEAANSVLGFGCEAVLIKDGHGSDSLVRDRLVTATATRDFTHPRRQGEFHGTGCTLSAAITALLALGRSLEEAVETAIGYLKSRIAAARLPQKGRINLLDWA